CRFKHYPRSSLFRRRLYSQIRSKARIPHQYTSASTLLTRKARGGFVYLYNSCGQIRFSRISVAFSQKNIRQKSPKIKASDFIFVERKTRFELATPTLARLCSTN